MTFYTINAHTNGVTFYCEKSGFNFCDTDVTRFKINRKSNFEHFKDRVEAKLQSGRVHQIIYRNLIIFDNYQVRYFQLKVRDNDDIQNMFRRHEYSRLNDIELYILIQQPPESQNFDQSQVFEESAE